MSDQTIHDLLKQAPLDAKLQGLMIPITHRTRTWTWSKVWDRQQLLAKETATDALYRLNNLRDELETTHSVDDFDEVHAFLFRYILSAPSLATQVERVWEIANGVQEWPPKDFPTQEVLVAALCMALAVVDGKSYAWAFKERIWRYENNEKQYYGEDSRRWWRHKMSVMTDSLPNKTSEDRALLQLGIHICRTVVRVPWVRRR